VLHGKSILTTQDLGPNTKVLEQLANLWRKRTYRGKLPKSPD